MRQTALFGLPHQNPPCTICIQHDHISNFRAFVMISEIYIDGFRLFSGFRLNLKDGATLLCGLNGTGKSSVVEMVHRLKMFIGFGETVDRLCPQDDIPVWEKQPQGAFTTRLGLKLEIMGEIFSYEVEILHNLRDKLSRVEKESLSVKGEIIYKSEQGKVKIFRSDERQGEFPVAWNTSGLHLLDLVNKNASSFIKYIRENIFTVCPNPARMDSFNSGREKTPDYDGQNFSAWYAWIESNHLRQAVEAMEDIAQIFPGFKQFAFVEHGASRELVGKIGDMEHDYPISFGQFSQGQKALALFYMLVRACPPNSTIMIDEMENHVSIVELQPLYDLANTASEERNIQFVFVSHNPKTINWYQTEAILLSATGFPATISMEQYNPNPDITIEDRLWIERGQTGEI